MRGESFSKWCSLLVAITGRRGSGLSAAAEFTVCSLCTSGRKPKSPNDKIISPVVILEPLANMMPNGMRRMASLFVSRACPLALNPSLQVVDQPISKTVDLGASSWTDAFTTLNKILSREYPLPLAAHRLAAA